MRTERVGGTPVPAEHEEERQRQRGQQQGRRLGDRCARAVLLGLLLLLLLLPLLLLLLLALLILAHEDRTDNNRLELGWLLVRLRLAGVAHRGAAQTVAGGA